MPEDLGTTNEREIFTWVGALKTGILKEDGMALTVFTFDGENLAPCINL
jgi:hypothetical protein